MKRHILFQLLLVCINWQFATAALLNIPEDYPTIQSGINASTDGDTVLVQEGTYIENINFNGKNILLTSNYIFTQDSLTIEQTVIDGNQNGSVVTIENNEDNSTIQGFSIINGYKEWEEDDGFGGGIFIVDSNPTLKHLIIRDNYANGDGGGIACYNSSPIIDGLIISSNSAGYGGGISCYLNSSPRITNTLFSLNHGAFGGGMGVFYDSNPRLINVQFINNSAFWDDASAGGGLFIEEASISIDNFIISGNEAHIVGGGIWLKMSTALLTNGLISQNSALSNSQGGGIFCWYDTDLELNHVTISENTADYGGGIAHQSATNVINLKNCIIWNNSPVLLWGHFGSYDIIYSDVQGYSDIDNLGRDNSIDENPLFCNSVLHNYSLAENSNCAGMGEDGSNMGGFGVGCEERYNGPVWHVSNEGSDAEGDGSTQSPYYSVQNGIDNASKTDTILVSDGTYFENLELKSKGVLLTSSILLDGNKEHIESTIIDGNQSGTVLIIKDGHDRTTIINGFTITNGGGTGPFHSGGIYCSSSNPILLNLLIYDNHNMEGGGLKLSNSSPRLQNVTIANNSSTLYYGGGIYMVYKCNPEFINVNILNNTAPVGGDGIFGITDINITFINSTLWNNSIYLAEVGDPNSIIVSHSNIENGTDAIITNDNTTLHWFDGNINSDPLFNDPENFDLTLQEESPNIDAGTSFFVWEGDTVLNLSPDQYYGDAPDIGAFEYGEFNGLIGDLNQDGEINILDIVRLANIILGDEPSEYELWAGDLNMDGNLDILDIVMIINLILVE